MGSLGFKARHRNWRRCTGSGRSRVARWRERHRWEQRHRRREGRAVMSTGEVATAWIGRREGYGLDVVMVRRRRWTGSWRGQIGLGSVTVRGGQNHVMGTIGIADGGVVDVGVHGWTARAAAMATTANLKSELGSSMATVTGTVRRRCSWAMGGGELNDVG
ncbi:hypothetical protein M0R45_030647 [Rubus argutus]|uniref:Uncharacterized protein n=1 Tax=Rubus argutus TaxID=59490 RepID=A0AAW1WCH5_RUBAR